jgi:glucose/arabinose dehydrogenase
VNKRAVVGGVVLVALIGVLVAVSTDGIRRTAIVLSDKGYQAPPAPMSPVFDGADAAREPIAVSLVPVAEGFEQPLGLEFVPGAPNTAVVLEKNGDAVWVDLSSGARQDLLSVDVLTDSELGLLGLAWHPEFETNGRFYLNYTARRDSVDVTVIEQWSAPEGLPGPVAADHVVLTVEQPYQNHNGGQLAFGPDGMLYVGLGDGGFRYDPQGHGQNAGTLLGAMLRLDVNTPPYVVPPDNPYVGDHEARQEIWAMGLRNPWRYSFAPDGRLIVADVGQGEWEEVDVVASGDNLGWNTREGAHCFEPAEGCATVGFTEPVWEYPHTEGQSITGGYVVTGAAVPALTGLYVFGDFIRGRIWALDLDQPSDVRPLGRWPLLVSTFAVDHAGDLYVVDFGGGTVYAVRAP